MTNDLVDQIYEAAFVPEQWPTVLDRMSAMSESAGGAVLALGQRHPPRWAASEIVAPRLRAYAESDAWKSKKRPDRWLSNKHMGFVRDVDLFSAEELEGRHVNVRTHGLGWQLGVVVPMPSGEFVVFSMERKQSDGPHSEHSPLAINPLLPHLSRAGLMSARLGLERARSTVTTLNAIGLPAAVITHSGRVLAVNQLLENIPGIFRPLAHGRMSIADFRADALFQQAVEQAHDHHVQVKSIAIPKRGDQPALVIHLLPLRRAAFDIFSGADVIVVATPVGAGRAAPSSEMLNGLFDLSPAESRLAASLATGNSLKAAAADQGIRISTARSYLEGIFRKTGTHQQSQIVALLNGIQFGPKAL